MATIRKLRGRWQAQVRRRGAPARAQSFDRRADAERWARELEAEADRTRWNADTRASETTTLGELLRRYANQITPNKRGAAPERARINTIVRSSIAQCRLAKLASPDVAQYRDERLELAAPATVARELSTVSHALEIAGSEWGFWLPRNPVKGVRRPGLPQGRTRRLESNEEERLLAASDEHKNSPLLRPLLVLALETAMRRGEILSLRWDCIDLELRVARLAQTKNGDSRDVPLSRRAVSALVQVHELGLCRDCPFPMTGSAVRSAFDRVRIQIGAPDLRFHDLRHEAISRLFEGGFNSIEVSAITGHRDVKMLKRYTHLRAADLATKLDSLLPVVISKALQT